MLGASAMGAAGAKGDFTAAEHCLQVAQRLAK